jgi:phosphatidylinositol glycan class O
MAERLTRMDALLLQAVEALPPDGILLMFGDHGMTDQGEHGGSSGNETDSGLFVYSKQPLFAVQPPSTLGEEEPTTLYWSEHSASLQRTPLSKIRQHPRMVSQLDLTPTLALLLGLPIPASSLGMVIPELFLAQNLQRNSSGSDDSAQGRFVTAGIDGLSDSFYINAMQVMVTGNILYSYCAHTTNTFPH